MAEWTLLLGATAQASPWLTLLSVTLSAGLPLLLAALGGLYSERSGIINIGLEGMMLAGAFAAGLTASLLPQHPTLGPWSGVLFAGAAGALFAGIHAWICIRMKADQIISGVAINILVSQGTIFLSMLVFGNKGGSPPVATVPEWNLGAFQITPLMGFGLLALVGSAWLLWRTPFGLRLRACGEHPKAAKSAGISVWKVRTAAVLISGFLAGLGGAILLNDAGRFGKEMTAGRGYIALAALIFGGWRPFPVFFACLFFGFAFSLKDQLASVTHFQVPAEWLNMLPYLLAIAALCGLVGRVQTPAALGRIDE